MSDNSKVVSLASDVVLQVIDGEALLLKLDDETVFSLNDTGARIAQLISEGQAVDAMVRALSGEYGRSRENVERDVNSLVQELLLQGLVVVDRIGGTV